jgi:hypothetical protein
MARQLTSFLPYCRIRNYRMSELKNFVKAVASIAVVAIGGCVFYIAGSWSGCDSADEQRAMIVAERPHMGDLEIKFWQLAIAKASNDAHVDPVILTSIVAQESHFRSYQVSNKGAKGPAQLMPMHTKDIDPFEIEANLMKAAHVFADAKEHRPTLRAALQYYNGGNTGEKSNDAKYYAASVLARVYEAHSVACEPTTKESTT